MASFHLRVCHIAYLRENLNGPKIGPFLEGRYCARDSNLEVAIAASGLRYPEKLRAFHKLEAGSDALSRKE